MRTDGWLLDPAIVFLNHGSFGACPVEVFDAYQGRQRELEARPVEFLARRFDGLLAEARAELAGYVGARVDDLVFAPNATSALNAVIRSLDLDPGDEVLTTPHEYGAIVRTWDFVRATLRVVQPAEVAGSIGPRTRVVFVSHVTSPTALVLPVEEICAAAREREAAVIVDGAHVPGHLALDLGSLSPDVYAGNCHKWLCAPKGSGFLWARPEWQGAIAPLVVSWGYAENTAFAERHGWQGTNDPAAYLAVPAAIRFQAQVDTERGRGLADEAVARLATLGCPPVPGVPAPRMRSVVLPPAAPDDLQERLRERHAVEVPVYEWEGRHLLRVSIGPYNDEGDIDRLVAALAAELPA